MLLQDQVKGKGCEGIWGLGFRICWGRGEGGGWVGDSSMLAAVKLLPSQGTLSQGAKSETLAATRAERMC